jgi:peptidoglycan hydrolase-like protein with peptidoglycan-binding domain
MKLSKLVIAIFAMSAAGAMAHGNKQQTSQTSPDQSSQATASADTSSSLMQGNNISQAQQALNDQGFDAGPVDGKFGPQTQAAVKKFQAAKSLTQTGKLDPQTLAALNAGSGNIASASTGDGANNASSPSSGTSAATTSSAQPSTSSSSSSMGTSSGSSSMSDTNGSSASSATNGATPSSSSSYNSGTASQQSSSTTK